MSEPVVCIKCGAVSYNDPGKTSLYCHSCYSELSLTLVTLCDMVLVLADDRSNLALIKAVRELLRKVERNKEFLEDVADIISDGDNMKPYTLLKDMHKLIVTYLKTGE